MRQHHVINPAALHSTTTPNPERRITTDKEAAQAWIEFSYGWMADPVYFGDYPASMRKALGDLLPRFTPEESAMLKGSMDMFSVNFYCELWGVGGLNLGV